MDAIIGSTHYCVRRSCRKPFVVTKDNARTLTYKRQPNVRQVIVKCGRCGAINELPPGVEVEVAAQFGCEERVMGDYATPAQMDAYVARTGRSVITIERIDQVVTTEEQRMLDRLAACSDVPAAERDRPSLADDMFDQGLRAIT